MKFIFGFVLLLAALSLFAERREYSRYESIVERQMFGKPPEGFDPSKPPSEVQKTNAKGGKELTKEQEQIKKSVRFSMINVNPNGETMVGFTDSSDAKNVRNYYLKVGETRDGWTVNSADPVTAKVSISKDGVDLELELGGTSGGGTPAKGGAPSPQAMTPQSAPRRLGTSPLLGTANGGQPGGTLGSLRERRQARMQQREAKERAEAEAKEKREAERKEREAREAEEKARQEADREQTKQELEQLKEEIKRTREAAAAAKESVKEEPREDPKEDAGAAPAQEE